MKAPARGRRCTPARRGRASRDVGDTTAGHKRRFLKSSEPLADVSAVRNGRNGRNDWIVTLGSVDLVESPRDPAAVGFLAAVLRGHGS
ncbi:hypothetical protein ADL07_33765 [Streptomyces sp. NRRL F-4707]|uniref:hypothetical protein n=1 Tax=Streptomyces sp. NRRL F-4707 TaxID=1519496 RepID=UPI0006ADA140|nr:hypothetical protein [Streptomyces sp. NRRL F-4707]KOX25213.1 hypothetical protein ADL07_33765 [Streptomyces sp. NRRL F-4707]